MQSIYLKKIKFKKLIFQIIRLKKYRIYNILLYFFNFFDQLNFLQKHIS